MHISLKKEALWSEYNTVLQNQLSLKKTVTQGYQGVRHALNEVGTGLARLFPHRKQIYFFKDLDPSYSSMMMDLAADGYELVPLSLEHFENLEWMEQLGRETLMVVYPIDDPIFGRLNTTAEFYAQLSEKKVFQLGVSHSAHFYQGWSEVHKYEARICSWSVERAVALLGERAQVKARVAPTLSWSVSELEKASFEMLSMSESRVCRFESKSVADSTALLSGTPRLYDRAVLTWLDMDGYAIVDQLHQLAGSRFQSGSGALIETSSLSRWGGMKTMNWLENYGYSKNQIRGTLVVAESCLDDEFESLLLQAVNNVKQMQRGQ